MAQSFKETAHLKVNQKKYEENFAAIDWETLKISRSRKSRLKTYHGRNVRRVRSKCVRRESVQREL